MTATASPREAVSSVLEAAALSDSGFTDASLQAITRLNPTLLALALNALANRGALSRIDGRWIAWEVCSTCGQGERHPDYDSNHGSGCGTAPHDRFAGYPLTH